MYIYAIGNETNRQKIGITNNPERRLKNLQTGNPDRISIHYAFKVDPRYAQNYESVIHNNHNHQKLVGEWFDMTPEECVSLVKYYEIMMESEFAKRGWF